MIVSAFEWNRPQSACLTAKADEYRYVDLEGAVRSGKTTVLIRKILQYCLDNPGIKCMLSRWTDDALKAQLKPRFYELVPKEFLAEWNSEEQYQKFKNGSLVYLRALKSSDEGMRYGKFAGLTLAVIGVDQVEEVPEDVWKALKARLSQAGYPQQLIVTPNPPGNDHWLCEEFPEDNSRKDHLYLTTQVYDNEKWLGRRYIESLEETYPPGTVLHRRFILGKRGLSTTGDPVYGPVFKRKIHVDPSAKPVKGLPLLESWDFGHKHPAVLWSQLPAWGGWTILGEFMGEDQYIEDFAPLVIERRTALFPDVEEVWTCCDPAGADNNSQGTRYNAIDVLNQLGIYPRYVKGSNTYDKREWAIQQIAKFMLRLTPRGPALIVHPRCATLIDGFEAGYVFEDKGRMLQTAPNIRRPLKDGYYDHLQNTAEYTMLNFVSGVPVAIGTAAEARRRLRMEQRDNDPYDRIKRPRVGRSGY